MSYCHLPNASTIDRRYHDTEWGVPVHDDKRQFEFLTLEVMQCGLSWELMLKKREIFRRAFADFDFGTLAAYTDADIDRIMNIDGMIKSPRKANAVINNARAFKKIREEYGSFSAYLWAYTNNKTLLYKGHETGILPAKNALSEKIGKDLKKRGFKYVGGVTIYSHMQACGIINDHDATCLRRKYIIDNYDCIAVEDDV